jgi:hypothetical protein
MLPRFPTAHGQSYVTKTNAVFDNWQFFFTIIEWQLDLWQIGQYDCGVFNGAVTGIRARILYTRSLRYG